MYHSVSFAKCLHPCNSKFYLDTEYYPYPRKFPPFLTILSQFLPNHYSNICHYQLVLSVLELHRNCVRQYLLFCVKDFLAQDITFEIYLCCFGYEFTPFSLFSIILLQVYTNCFTLFPPDRYLTCFHFVVILIKLL